jgi:hypothetical protein
VGCAGDRDRSEDRPGTGHVDQPQPQAQDKPAVALAPLAQRQPGERAVQQFAEPAEDHPQAYQHQEDQAAIVQDVHRQPERADQERAEQGKEAEAQDQPGDDGVRAPVPPRLAGFGSGFQSLLAGAAREEHDRQHRQDAGRDPGDETTRTGALICPVTRF